MRKFAIFAAALAVAFATFAALDFQTARAIPALAPQTISAGTTVRPQGRVAAPLHSRQGRRKDDTTAW